jgi:Integrase core domain
MGIRDKPIGPASPWQNGFAERLIGSIRRECVDHMIVLGEQHRRRILKSYPYSRESIAAELRISPPARPIFRRFQGWSAACPGARVLSHIDVPASH